MLRPEACAPVYLRNIIVIMVDTGLRPYRELIPMRKEQVDLQNGTVKGGVKPEHYGNGEGFAPPLTMIHATRSIVAFYDSVNTP